MPNSVEEYISSCPLEAQEGLSRMRKLIKAAAPEAEEKISYGMPYYGYKGRLAYFKLNKKHIGLYIPPPIIENFTSKLDGYKTAKSTIQFPLSQKLPENLITELIIARKRWNEENERFRKFGS